MRQLTKAALLLAACAAPFALAGWVGVRFVEAAGGVGQSLAAWQPRNPGATQAAPDAAAPESEAQAARGADVEFELAPPATVLTESSAPAPARRDLTSPSPRPAQKLIGIRIRKARVLALSRSAGIPGGSFVQASEQHPAGLMLSGVSGLGVGVQDGDVLTHAAGQPVHSVAQVIGLVAGARHAKAPAISGTLYRGAQRIQLHVEMPYLERRHRRRVSRSADGSAAPPGTATAKGVLRPEPAPRAESSMGRRDGLARASKRPRVRLR